MSIDAAEAFQELMNSDIKWSVGAESSRLVEIRNANNKASAKAYKKIGLNDETNTQ